MTVLDGLSFGSFDPRSDVAVLSTTHGRSVVHDAVSLSLNCVVIGTPGHAGCWRPEEPTESIPNTERGTM